MSGASVQDLVIGHVLADLGKRSRLYSMLGNRQTRATRALTRNVATPRSHQSVVKRIRNGVKCAADLRRLLDYVARDEGVKATWCNLAGYERDLRPGETTAITETWSSTWRGAPKRGHADHIVVSFPAGVSVVQAEAIAREWGETVFGSGEFGDSWRYVAAVHMDTDHAHAHFVVDKHGIDNGQFLSISAKADLNFDIMRELHAEISQAHGVNIVATSRLSRGVIDHPPRETEVRAAHGTGKQVPTPEMSEGERARRLAIVSAFAGEYQTLGRLAALAVSSEPQEAEKDEGGSAEAAAIGQGAESAFMDRLAAAFFRCADQLVKGQVVMADTSLQTLDPAERLERARQSLIETARQTWAEIQAMDPGAEKTQLEGQFADQTRSVVAYIKDDPFLEAHSAALNAADDPYRLDVVASLHSARETAERDGSSTEGIDRALEDLRERLVRGFSERGEERLEAAGTTAEEMAERFMLPDRTRGQVAEWNDSLTIDPPHINLINGRTGETIERLDPLQAGRAFAEIDPADRPSAVLVSDNGFSFRDVGRTVEDRDGLHLHVAHPQVADHRPEEAGVHRAFHDSFTGQELGEHGQVDWRAGMRADFLQGLRDAASWRANEYELSRDALEAVARDQVLSAKGSDRLVDLPAIQRLAEDVRGDLRTSEVEQIAAGDRTPLQDQIKDPTLRAAIASELKHEAEAIRAGHDLAGRDSASVSQYQGLLRQRAHAHEHKIRAIESDAHEL
jgi:type IV secretion system T-DNA border endonuclease VirD2